MYQQCPGAVGPVPDGTRLGQPFGISRWMRSSGGLCLPARERELAWAALPRGADHPDKREAGAPLLAIFGPDAFAADAFEQPHRAAPARVPQLANQPGVSAAAVAPPASA